MTTEPERPQLLRLDVAAHLLDIKPRTLGAQWRGKLRDIQALVDQAGQ